MEEIQEKPRMILPDRIQLVCSPNWNYIFGDSEYFKKGKIVKQILEGKDHVFTPSICIMEIKNKYLQEGQKFQDRIDFICKNSSIIDIDQEVALITADIKNTYKLYTVDALVYTIAQRQKSTLLTGDAHFKDLENVKLL